MLKLNMPNSTNDLATNQFVKDTVEKSENKLSKQINQLRNDIDGLAKLIRNSLDERTIQKYRQEKLEKKVDQNRKRIIKLEQQSANA
jgi:regulator of replication initiation timing